jgi:hypothetical protein
VVKVDAEGQDLSTGSRAVYVIGASDITDRRLGLPDTNPHNLVLNVADLIEAGIKAADVLAAVETSVTMTGATDGLEIRFHEPTGLIIVRGIPEQVDAMSMVVTALRESPQVARKIQDTSLLAELNQARSSVTELHLREKALQEEVNAIKRERTEAAVRLEATMAELERVREWFEKSEQGRMAAEDRVRSMKAEFDAVSLRVQESARQRDQAMQEINQLKHELDAARQRTKSEQP